MGPELFTQGIVKAYIAWLKRCIVSGPIGAKLKHDAEARRNGSVNTPLERVLIAGALPPIIEDQCLERIPDKYVDRLEDHLEQTYIRPYVQSQSSSPAPHREPRVDSQYGIVDDISRLSVNSPSLVSQSSSSLSRGSSAQESSAPTSAASSYDRASADDPEPLPRTIPISKLVDFELPLCDLTTRMRMTNFFNDSLRRYCATVPDILAFVDITPAMLHADPVARQRMHHTRNEIWDDHAPAPAVDRSIWGDDADPSNVHIMWEQSLPLWLDDLRRQGVPCQDWKTAADLGKTLKEYEIEKQQRVADRERRDARGLP